jgi:esterase/lipase
MLYNQPKLFTDPAIDYPIYDLNLSFSDYITQCQTLIINTRTDLKQPAAEKIIAANSPFELRPPSPGKYGALLIHGLFDSPFIMRDIGLYLQAQGILVRAILLPGHGTVPGSLLNVNYEQWLQTLRYGITSLTKEVDQIFLVGFSTGAILALHHAIQNAEKLAGLVLLAPALKIRSPLACLSNWHPLLSWAWKRANWLHIDAEETVDYAKYQSIPFNAVYQVYRLTQAIKKMNQPSLPLFFALSDDDLTVASQASLSYFQQNPHAKSRLLLYLHLPRPLLDNPRIILHNAAYPRLRIRHLSHIALPTAADNPHYGIGGDYCYASHTGREQPIIYGEFSSLKIRFSRLVFKLKLSPYYYQRLTFNPDFLLLTQAIDQFICNL